MPQSAHDRSAELHKSCSTRPHRRSLRAQKGDYLTAHELTKKALEHSMNAFKHAEELAHKAAKSSK
jgi:hypothetical protein